MLIIGCDFHTCYQQTATAREETSEWLASMAARRLLARALRYRAISLATGRSTPA